MTVIALGEATIDWLSLERGRSIMTATNFYRYIGGNTTNVAIGLARLGTPAKLIAKIGCDFHGAYIKSILAGEGVDTSCLIEDDRYHTAQCYMTVDEQGLPVYRNWPAPHAADMLSADEIQKNVFSNASLMHCTGISLVKKPRRDAILAGLQYSKDAGVIISFDACFPTGQGGEAREAAMQALSVAHLVKMNLEELAFWSEHPRGTDVPLMVRDVLKIIQPIALIVTMGEDGANLYTPAGEFHCPSLKVDTVCDVGAGDAFMAGLLWSLHSGIANKMETEQNTNADMRHSVQNFQSMKVLNTSFVRYIEALTQHDWLQAARSGAACGALCTTSIGATESFPNKTELQSLLAPQHN